MRSNGSIAWISVAPVKGLRLEEREEVLLTEDGVPGDRAFFIVDANRGAMVSATRLGPLVGVVPAYDQSAETLRLRFPDGKEVAGAVELGDAEKVRFVRRRVPARPVLGGYSEALSEHCGTPVRLFATPPEGSALDRGRDGAATLLSVASLERLRLQAGVRDPVDARRFRMTFGIEGLEPHEEDGWVGHEVRAGEALLRITGNVGRCALTTRDADTGVVDFKALHHLAYRGDVDTTEKLPFGVHGQVVEPGLVRRGDPVAAALF